MPGTRTPLGERTPRTLTVTAAGVSFGPGDGRSSCTGTNEWTADALTDATCDPGWGVSTPTGGWVR